jgi:TPR repeat protein
MLPAICLAAAVSAPPRALAADGEQQVVPPPVPLYASHVSKTSVLAPGIVVIDSEDSFDTVLGWYRANLKDRMADVTLGPQHQHFLTRTGAGVDISATGAGGRPKTKISLLWKPTGSGGYVALAPERKPTAAPAPAQSAFEKDVASTPLPSSPPAKTVTDESVPVQQAPPTAEQRAVEEPPPEKIALPALQPKIAVESAAQAQALPRPTTQQVPEEPPPEKVAMAVLQPKVALEATPRAQALPRLKTTIVAAPPKLGLQPRETPEPRLEVTGKGAEAKGLAFFRAGQYAEALLSWEDAAETGNAAAALFLGMMHDAGEGVPQSYPQALNWYRMAAEGGSVVGLFNLGAMYDAGLGVRQDMATAADWYARAAAKGSGRAAFNLALLLEKGDGVAQDPQGAVEYFRQAARLGITAARGHLRVSRIAVADDMDQSFNTLHDIPGDAPKGANGDIAERIRAAAGQGDAAAQYDLAYRLERGMSGSIDLGQAYALYVQAAAATPDSRLKAVANASAYQIRTHLEAARPRP